MNFFEDLIQQLSTLSGIPLRPDSNQSCLILFENEIKIQIDLDTNADRLLMGTQLGNLIPGIHRESVFLQALSFNATATLPRPIFAFSEKQNSLILFQFLSLEKLTGEKLHHAFQQFYEETHLWKEALAGGYLPQLYTESPSQGKNLYGLHP